MKHYSIINNKGYLLNIRKFDSENNPLWNSYKEKRHWIADNYDQAYAQMMLLKQKEEDCQIVEITEINEPAKERICLKCGSDKIYHKEIHADTGMDEFVWYCPECNTRFYFE